MKTKIIGIIAIVAILAWSCGQNNEARESGREYNASYQAMEESADDMSESMHAKIRPEAYDSRRNYRYEEIQHSPQTYISSSAAVENPNDTTRNFIRTADIKFQVKDVISATYNIEDIVVRHSGFVENTELSSQINNTKEICIKEDSTLVITYYTVLNTLVLRVPNTKLDTTLKEIAKLVDFMDYRIIKAKDVSLDLLSKKLERARLANYDSRMKSAIDNKGKKLNDLTDAEDNLLDKQEQADEAKLENLRILDKIKFSTIHLSLYQNQSIKYESIAKEKDIKPYSTSFGVRVVDALKFGWIIIVEICLFIVRFWSVILIAALVFFGVKYLRKRGIKLFKK